MTKREHVDRLLTLLMPELVKLCEHCPSFGSITLEVHMTDKVPSRISLGIDTARKLIWDDAS